MRSGDVVDGRFLVEEFVARGGMGDVYRALDCQSSRPVALKVISIDDPRFVARFSNEAHALIELAHPAIVRYVAHGESSDHGRYLAMEWLHGVNLRDRLQVAPLTLDEALTLGARIADGLAAAHAHGMVHRDIKPLNLMLVGGKVDQVKILDFGLVRLSSWQQITATGAGIGTPEYMAPEQVRGERTIGPAADVFSLGCVLFRCLTGRPAFSGENMAAVLAKIALLERPPRMREVRADLPALVDDLVARMMAYRPAERPADGADAAKRIREVQAILQGPGGEDAPVELHPQPSLTRREQQPVSVLVVDPGIAAEGVSLGPTDPEPVPVWAPTLADPHDGAHVVVRGPSEAWRRVLALPHVMKSFSAKVYPLVDGSLVALLSGGEAVTDLAVRSARCALALRELFPDSSVGVATDQAVADDRTALARLIDEAAARRRRGSRTIRIDARAQRLLPERFEVRDAEDGCFELLAEREGGDVYERPRRLLGRQMPCVGRRRLLKRLFDAYLDCAEDRAADAVVVVGEAGVGKSRLRAELLRMIAGDRAATILSARGDPVRAQVPFAAVARALRGHFAPGISAPDVRAEAITAGVERRVTGEDGRRVSEFLGEICGIPFPAEDSPALRAARSDPALMADQRRRAFEDWLDAESRAQPVVLVLDDLQWLDHATVDLVTGVLRRGAGTRVFVLALGRPEANERFPRLDEDWRRHEIRLAPLRPDDCVEFVRAALGDRVDDATAARLVERSAGNPFFLEELVRGAVAGGAALLPDTVLGSVQLRLGRLPEAARQVLRAASIFGSTFSPGGVAHLLGGDIGLPDVERWLDGLEEEELVYRRARDAFAFRHDLLRQAAYGMLTGPDRAVGHRLAGDFLLAAGETDPVILAEHFAGGGAIDQALERFQSAAEDALSADAEGSAAVDALRKAAGYLRRAAEICASTYANENAIAFYDRAIALFSALDPGEAGRARLACARVLDRSGQRDRAREQLERAGVDAQGAGDARTRIEVLLGRAEWERRGAGEGALKRSWELAEEARDLAQGAGIRELEARALTSLAATVSKNETEESSQKAIQLARLAVSLTSEHGDLGIHLLRLGNAFLVRNELDRAGLLYRDGIAFAERAGNDSLVAQCHANLGLVMFRRWDLDAAVEETQRALVMYQRVGHRVRIAEARLNLGVFFVKRGDFPLAEMHLSEVLAAAGGDWILSTACQESLAELERHRGDEERAQSYLDAAWRLCEKVGSSQKQAHFLGKLAESYWAGGQAGKAVDCLQRATGVLESVTLSHALILSQLGDPDQAEGWLDAARDADPDPDRRAAARVALARVCWWQGRHAEARVVCQEALEILAPAPLPRHMLAAEALLACLDGQAGVAVRVLRAAQVHCSPTTCDEISVDVGTLLEQADIDEANTKSWLALSRVISHTGVGYHIAHLRRLAYRRLGDRENERVAQQAALTAVRSLLRSLPEELVDQVSQHPWIAPILDDA